MHLQVEGTGCRSCEPEERTGKALSASMGLYCLSLGLSSSAATSDLHGSAVMENFEYSVCQRGSLKSVLWIMGCFTYPVAACNCFCVSFHKQLTLVEALAIAEFMLLLMSRQPLGQFLCLQWQSTGGEHCHVDGTAEELESSNNLLTL